MLFTNSDHDLNIYKFQRNRIKTVVGVAYTRYLLLEGGHKDSKANGSIEVICPSIPLFVKISFTLCTCIY